MRRRRSSDPLGKLGCVALYISLFVISSEFRMCLGSGDTASNLGSAVDELMRHQPTLKTDATTAIIKVI